MEVFLRYLAVIGEFQFDLSLINRYADNVINNCVFLIYVFMIKECIIQNFE